MYTNAYIPLSDILTIVIVKGKSQQLVSLKETYVSSMQDSNEAKKVILVIQTWLTGC